jgi:flagellar biosynthetic protein FliR
VAHQIAGRFIDVQLGYGMANVVDPMSDIQTSILSRFKGILAIAIFLSIDGHHLLINAVHNSLEFVPFDPTLFKNEAYQGIIRLSADIFIISMKISAPVVVTLILTDVGMGIIARIVPQMNVFIVGFPLKILLGVAMLILSMPFIIKLFEGLLLEMNNELNTILHTI